MTAEQTPGRVRRWLQSLFAGPTERSEARDGEPVAGSPHHGHVPEAVDETAAAELVIGLRAPELAVRLESAQALASLRYPPAADALLAVLRNAEENDDVRGNAAMALGRIGEERATRTILSLLEDEEMEGYAAEALCAMSGGLDQMSQRLAASPRRRGGSGEHPRARVVRALGAVGRPASIGALSQAATDPDSGVRIEVARALNAVIAEARYQGSLAPVEYEHLRTAVAGVLQRLLSDADGRVRLAALEAQIDPPGRGVLVALAGDPEPNVRRAACHGLGRLGARDAFDPLAVARTDDDELVRCAALDGLGRLDDARVVPLLIASLDDASDRVRGAAARALATENAPWIAKPLPVVTDALVRGLGDRCGEVRLDGVRALGALGQKGAIPALRALASDPDASVRDAAAAVALVLERNGR